LNPATRSFLKNLPIYPLLDRCRDWQTRSQGKLKRTFSQHGEDRFVLDYFKKHSGFYLDVGANHPFRISNTYLLYLNGWRGITVEPMPHLSQKHRQYRPKDWHFNVGAGAQEGTMKLYELTPFVLSTFDKDLAHARLSGGSAVLSSTREIQIRTVSSLLKEAQAQETIDFLNVDCEGYDLRVLEGIDWFRTKPTLICVETEGIVGSRSPQGSEISRFLVKQGYRAIAERGCNTFFELLG
jgi:FkbM family methyltransferase